MRTIIKDANLVASRRDRIARAATHIMVHKSYDKVSTQEIAEACGMTIGNLYQYIGKKEDIIYLIMQRATFTEKFCQEVDMQLIKMSPRETLIWAIDRYYRTIDDVQDIILFMFQETKNMNSDFREVIDQSNKNIFSAFMEIIQHGRQKDEFKVDNIYLLVEDIVVSGYMWAVRRWTLRKTYSLDEYIQQRTQLTLNILTQVRAIV